MSLNINKNGIVNTDLYTEFIANTFDKNLYVEPDGSAWIRIVHHNNPANALFGSGNSFSSQVYLDADRWFNASLCNYLSGSWELMVKQAATSGATEYKYRWIQTTNPMTSNFDQTKAANITKITTSGYTSGAGGIYYNNGANSYFVINNGSNGNWFGAFGCWSAYQGGIPGYPNTTVTTGYMDLYLRIDDKANLSKTSFGKDYILSKEILEI